MGPLNLRVVKSSLSVLLLSLVRDEGLLHLRKALGGLTVGLGRGWDRLTAQTLVHQEQARWCRCKVGQPEFKCSLVDERLKLLLEMVDPLHGVEGLERGVVHRILNVREGVEGQELRRLRKFGTAAVQVVLEVSLFNLELLFAPLPEVLIIVRVEDVDDEVEVKVELELLGDEVAPEHLLGNQHLPGFEESVLVPLVERR